MNSSRIFINNQYRYNGWVGTASNFSVPLPQGLSSVKKMYIQDAQVELLYKQFIPDYESILFISTNNNDNTRTGYQIRIDQFVNSPATLAQCIQDSLQNDFGLSQITCTYNTLQQRIVITHSTTTIKVWAITDNINNPEKNIAGRLGYTFTTGYQTAGVGLQADSPCKVIRSSVYYLGCNGITESINTVPTNVNKMYQSILCAIKGGSFGDIIEFQSDGTDVFRNIQPFLSEFSFYLLDENFDLVEDLSDNAVITVTLSLDH
jgi:hypothetical protein